MSATKERFEKILALAIDPGAYDGEAVAAMRRAYELVKKNRGLIPPAPQPVYQPAQPKILSNAYKITNIQLSWVSIISELLSRKAYELDLKSKLEYDFSQTLTGVSVTFDGTQEACTIFEAHINWVIEYVNSQKSQT